MFVHLRVPFALFRANPTGLKACVELLSDQPHIRLGQPSQDTGSCFAHVGTVKVQTGAADEIPAGLLAQASVCTGRTTLGAVVAGFEAFCKTLDARGGCPGVGA